MKQRIIFFVFKQKLQSSTCFNEKEKSILVLKVFFIFFFEFTVISVQLPLCNGKGRTLVLYRPRCLCESTQLDIIFIQSLKSDRVYQILLCLWSHLCEVYHLFLQNLALIYRTECEAGPNLNTEGQYKKPVFMTAWPCCLCTHRYTYLMRHLFNSVRRILPSLHRGNKSSCADEAHELFSSQQWWQYRLQRLYAVRHAVIEEWYINMHWSVSVCLAFSGFCICVFQSINL